MNIDELKVLFPLKGQVTQEILDNAIRDNAYCCVGAMTLGFALAASGCNNRAVWAKHEGHVIVEHKHYLAITTEEKLDMMRALIPQEVTFILSDIQPYLNNN